MNQEYKNIIRCVFASDNNYVPYLAVTIKSLLEHISNENFYEIYILENGISLYNQKLIKNLNLVENVKIEFINVDIYLEELKQKKFYTAYYLNLSTYFRFFVTKIFKDFDKILYLDCDIIILEDIANLYNIEMPDDNLLAAVRDYGVINLLNDKERIDIYKYENYFQNKLNLAIPTDYFQAGVILMNLKQLKKLDLINLCVEKTKEIGPPLFVDQCILNSLFYNKVKLLPMKWNLLSYLLFDDDKMFLPSDIKNEYFEMIYKQEGIIHFATFEKPWLCPHLPLAEIWWQYARLTPFYEEIIYINSKKWSNVRYDDRNIIENEKYYRFKYFKYKILSLLSFGKKQAYYKEKLKLYKFNYEKAQKLKEAV